MHEICSVSHIEWYCGHSKANENQLFWPSSRMRRRRSGDTRVGIFSMATTSIGTGRPRGLVQRAFQDDSNVGSTPTHPFQSPFFCPLFGDLSSTFPSLQLQSTTPALSSTTILPACRSLTVCQSFSIRRRFRLCTQPLAAYSVRRSLFRFQ